MSSRGELRFGEPVCSDFYISPLYCCLFVRVRRLLNTVGTDSHFTEKDLATDGVCAIYSRKRRHRFCLPSLGCDSYKVSQKFIHTACYIYTLFFYDLSIAQQPDVGGINGG